jgi:hypothetical protein
VLILFGLFVVAITVWDLSRSEANTVFIFEPLWFLDFPRSSFPLIFWTIITLQSTAGLYLILAGIFDLDVSWILG